MANWILISVILIPVAALVAGAIFGRSISTPPPTPLTSTTVQPFRYAQCDHGPPFAFTPTLVHAYAWLLMPKIVRWY
jgi:hypothetical protein